MYWTDRDEPKIMRANMDNSDPEVHVNSGLKSPVGLTSGILFAFLISSPIMNTVLFFSTSGALRLEMTIMRTIASLVMGVAAVAIME